jgi:hypothetical protein
MGSSDARTLQMQMFKTLALSIFIQSADGLSRPTAQ